MFGFSVVAGEGRAASTRFRAFSETHRSAKSNSLVISSSYGSTDRVCFPTISLPLNAEGGGAGLLTTAGTTISPSSRVGRDRYSRAFASGLGDDGLGRRIVREGADRDEEENPPIPLKGTKFRDETTGSEEDVLFEPGRPDAVARPAAGHSRRGTCQRQLHPRSSLQQ